MAVMRDWIRMEKFSIERRERISEAIHRSGRKKAKSNRAQKIQERTQDGKD